MTGAEHYLEAERLLKNASDENFLRAIWRSQGLEAKDVEAASQLGVQASMLAAAQVHATLALAAASNFPDQDGYGS